MPLTAESALRKDRTTQATLEHRHFAFIASVLAECEDLANWGVFCRRFADACARTNPRFDRARFLRACGLED